MFNGAFSEIPAPRLGSLCVKASLERAKARAEEVDEVYFGNVLGAGLGQNVARQVALGAGLPVSCGATTVNKVCGSAMRAIVLAAQGIQCRDAEMIIAGGTENMTRVPYLLDKARGGYKLGNGELVDAMLRDGLTDAGTGRHMALCAEDCAKEAGIDREQQDSFAIDSFKRLIAATEAGRFKEVMVPVEVRSKAGPALVDRDEEPGRFNEEKFRKLRPVFDANGTITAGNASAISDGAASVVVVSEEKAKAAGIKPWARILGYANVALEPERFSFAPIHAIRKVCERLSLRVEQIDLFEINEAFSLVPLAAMRELKIPHEKVDVSGGAVAMGHPIGASGARIVVALMNALRHGNKKLGLATACIGGGEASAIVIERC
jgi:acetyl-CoA C-acetyltransferase